MTDLLFVPETEYQRDEAMISISIAKIMRAQ